MISSPRFVKFLIVLMGVVASVGGISQGGDPSDVEESLSPERRPYRVRLLLAFDPVLFDSTAEETVIRDIRHTVRRCVGDLWSLHASEISWLSPVSEQGLERLDLAVVREHQADEKADIWLVAVIEARPVGLRVSVRSWQPEVQSETRHIAVDVLDHRDIAVLLLRLCQDLVRPTGIVEQVNDRVARIRLRAGELSSPDPSFAQLASGDVLVPMLAYRNKDGLIEKLQSIPWTFITIDEVEGSTVMGTVQSGLKLALGGKKRGRIDTLVVALRPQYEATRLELYSQTKPPVPLVAHRLEIRTHSVIPRPDEEHPEADPALTLLDEKLTDRRGMTLVSRSTDHPRVWLFAYSGQHLLARVPFVPGSVSGARLEVPDDASRFSTEADLQMLQGEVIDAVALRNTAIATIRAAAKKDDWATVNQKLTLLKQQQNLGALLDRLTAVRVAGIAAARTSKDKIAEARINRMCDETATLVNVHLSLDKVRLLSEEMEALQNSDAESKAGQ